LKRHGVSWLEVYLSGIPNNWSFSPVTADVRVLDFVACYIVRRDSQSDELETPETMGPCGPGNGKFRVSITIDEGLMARIVKLHTTPSALVGRP